MKLLRLKKAMSTELIVLIIALVGFLLIMGWVMYGTHKLDESSLLYQCKASHAARIASGQFELEYGFLSWKPAADKLPIACTTIKKTGGDALQPQGTSEEQQRDWIINQLLLHAVRTWDANLGGTYRGLYPGEIGGKPECMVQYVLSFDESSHFSESNPLSPDLFLHALQAKEKDLVPLTDGCDIDTRSGARIGECIPQECRCGEPCTPQDSMRDVSTYNEHAEQLSITRRGFSCDNPADTCCVAQTTCESSGGTCVSSGTAACEGVGVAVFGDQWSCGPGKTCCVQPEQQITYLEYFDHEGGGPGTVFIDLGTDEGFKPDTAYALAFISPSTRGCSWCDAVQATLTVTAAGAAIYFTGGLAVPVIAAAGTWLASESVQEPTEEFIAGHIEEEYSTLYIGRLDRISDVCNVWERDS